MTRRIDINVYADVLTRIQLTQLPYVDTILDLGSGGCVIREVTPYEETKITFTDLEKSDNWTFQIKKSQFESLPNYTFVETPSDKLSMFEDKSFDRVVFSHLIEHLTTSQIDGTMKEINRVLKDDGKLILITPNKTGRERAGKLMSHLGHIQEFTGQELLSLIDTYGFEATNEKKGIVEVGEPSGEDKRITINPVLTADIDSAYILFFVCERKK